MPSKPFPNRTVAQVQEVLRSRSVLNENGCWVWTGPKRGKGYGQFMWNRNQGAHRASIRAFKMAGSLIPKGMVVRHSCDNPSCVNPDHLSLGTQSDNIADMDTRGRRNQVCGMAVPHNKLSDDDVVAIRTEYAGGLSTQREIADRYNVNPSQISRCVNFKRHAHVA